MSEYRDDFTDLLGAYALDAIDPDERERIEAHLRTCHWCSGEVAEHREVASFLSQSGTDAPEGVWDRIVAELSPPAPPLRMSFTPEGEVDPLAPIAGVEPAPERPVAPVISLATRRSVRVRTLAAVVAAAAVLIVAVGGIAFQQGKDASPTVAGSATSTTIDPSGAKLQVRLIGADAKSGAQAVVDPSGRGVLVSHDLPQPGADELYQLWGQVDGVVLSLGTFGGGTDVVNFQVDPSALDDVQAFAVTKERAPGVLASEQPAVLSGKVKTA